MARSRRQLVAITAPHLVAEQEWLREFVRQAEGHPSRTASDEYFVANIRRKYVHGDYNCHVSEKQRKWILDIWERVKLEPKEVWEDYLMGEGEFSDSNADDDFE